MAADIMTRIAYSDPSLAREISMQKIIRYITSTLNITRAGLAGALGIPKNTLHGWYHQTSLIPLPSLLDIGYSLRAPIEDIVTCQLKETRLVTSTTSYCGHDRSTGPLDMELRGHLIASFTRIPPPSLQALAREFGVDRRLLRIKFPDLSRKVVGRREAFIKERHDRRIAKLKFEIWDSIELLKTIGQAPTRRNVEIALGKPGLLRELALRDAWLDGVAYYNTDTGNLQERI